MGDGFAPRPVAPVSFGGPVRARKPGGVRTKGREQLPVASPPSCLPRPLPSSPAPSSFKPRLARVVSVQSRPPPSEEMAEEPEPQVKGARPPPAQGPRGRPASPLRRTPEPDSSLPCSLPRLPPRMIAPPAPPIPTLYSAPLGRPLPTRREGVGRAPGVYRQCFTITLTLKNSRDGLGAGVSPLLRVWSQGLAGGSPAVASVGAWGAVLEKLGGFAGQVYRLADSVVRGGGRRGVPRDGPGGAGASWKQPKQCVLTGVPRKQWPGPSTRAGRRARLQGRGRGLAWLRTSTRTPSTPPGAPKSVPQSPCLMPISEQAVHQAAFPRCVIGFFFFNLPL